VGCRDDCGCRCTGARVGWVPRLNRWRCPLTAVAARYTDDRRANFDMYLPEWLARYNKQIFGPLYALGVAYLVMRYLIAG